MTSERAAEEAMLRSMVSGAPLEDTGASGHGRLGHGRENTGGGHGPREDTNAREAAREAPRPRFKPCDVCFALRKRAARAQHLELDPDAACKLCSRCHTRAAAEAAEEVRKARPRSAIPGGGSSGGGGRGGSSGGGGRGGGGGGGFSGLPFTPASATARGYDALEAALRDAEAAVALAGSTVARVAALHRAAQLRLALEAVGAVHRN
jgi:hypothetical protein